MSDIAFVYSEPGIDYLSISFRYDSKELEFNRNKIDSLEKTLQRIILKLQPKKKKKKLKTENKKEVILDNPFTVEVFDKANSPIDVTATNENSFQEGNCIKINNSIYNIKVNLPKVKQMVLLNPIMVDFQIFPIVELLFATKDYSQFLWYKSDVSKENWKLLSETFEYTPKIDDLSMYFKCVCIAGSKDKKSPLSVEIISENPVSANPGICLFDKRHLFTPTTLKNNDEFRAVSYNILADVFVDTDYGKNILYPYCPSYALNYKYRVQLLLKELLGYHADIIALQECERKILHKFLMPVFSERGYSSLLQLKIGEMPEGEGIIYNTKKFSVLEDFSLSVRELLTLKCNRYIMNIIEKIPDIYDALVKTITIAQVILFEYISTQPKKLICVVNTHLYYKAYFDDIRVLQMALIFNYVHEKLSTYDNVAILLLGDLNVAVGKPLLEYLNGVEINNEHVAWKRSSSDLIKSIPIIKCPFNVQNFSGLHFYSHYVPHFQNTLDYIFGDKERLKCINVVPLPDKSELDAYFAIPSVVSPSDHLPVITDICWN